MPGLPAMTGNARDGWIPDARADGQRVDEQWASGSRDDASGGPFFNATPTGGRAGGGAMADFTSLMQLITSTVEGNWESEVEPIRSNRSVPPQLDRLGASRNA